MGKMIDSIRMELPLRAPSKIFSVCKTMKDLKDKYPALSFVKYIYFDPADKMLKGTNPPDEILLFPDSYLTVAGPINEIIKFAEDATTKE